MRGGGGHGVAFLLRLRLQTVGVCLCLFQNAFGLAARLRKGVGGGGVGVRKAGLHRVQIVIGGGLRGGEHVVQLQRGLRDGTGAFQPELPVLQLRGERGVLRLELVLVLFQRIDDLYQFSAVHSPQFTICHLRTNSRM